MSSDEQPELPQAVPERRRRRWSPSLVWLIPVVAAVIGGYLAVQAVLSRGPEITIRFQSAEGLEAGKTRIKYKDVDIGEVTGIRLSEDRQSIVATAQLVKDAAPFLVSDSRFWVVRPRISGGSVSGLGTLLSGAYIGLDVGKSGEARQEFVGLEAPPIINSDLPGRRFQLHSATLGSLNAGSPVYFRRVPVGQVVGYQLDPSGKSVRLDVFINAPYDRFVTSDTRFWHASGVDVALGANGLKVSTESLAAIALGGIAFETPLDGGSEEAQAAPNATFPLSENREKALQNPDSAAQNFRLRFRETLRGLAVGAPVDFRGLIIGEVTAIGVEYAPSRKDFDMMVAVRVYPGRIRALTGDPNLDRKLPIETLVGNGLRAQLRSGSLITGQLYVALDFFPNAAGGKVISRKGWQELPTMPGDLVELQRLLQNVARKLDRIPLDSIGTELDASLKSLHKTLDGVDKLSGKLDEQVLPELLKSLQGLQQTLDSTQRAMRADSPLQDDMRGAARDVSDAARSIRTLTDYLSQHPEALVRGKKDER